MHGAPGSQNGEMHSGCITGISTHENKKPDHYFVSRKNKKIAVETVGVMAQKCAEHLDHCYGVGVLNEPQPGDTTPSREKLHLFLESYYGEAILEARKYLSMDVPVILFSWVIDFWRWSDLHYPAETYGTVVWDTHMYPGFGYENVDRLLEIYGPGLFGVRRFQDRQQNGVIVGEFTIANLSEANDCDHQADWQKLGDGVFAKIKTSAQVGALLWNYDC